jgi:prepilin-type N-terminal cleavage/methylation domain-containing protein
MYTHKKRTVGFTLVEILIASAVLSIFTFFGYKVFIAMSRSFQKGSWALATQNKLRNGLHFVREEMQKATYRTDVTLGGTVISDVGFQLKLASADTVTSGDIAQWYICLPFVSGDADSPGAIFKCELKLENGVLLLSKGKEQGDDPLNKERLLNNYKVIDNVEEVRITEEPFDPDNERMGSMITLEILVRHHDRDHFPEAQVIDRTGAKVEVEVLREL